MLMVGILDDMHQVQGFGVGTSPDRRSPTHLGHHWMIRDLKIFVIGLKTLPSCPSHEDAKPMRLHRHLVLVMSAMKTEGTSGTSEDFDHQYWDLL